MASLRLTAELTLNTARTNILAMYKGTVVGFTWAILSPVIMLAIYTTVFTYMFSARWPGFESTTGFAFHLFVGMILHGWLSDVLTRAPTLVVHAAPILKRLRFPVPVLTYGLVASSALQAAISFLVLTVMLFISGTTPAATTLLAPLFVLPFIVLLVGLGLLVSALGVYFRDLAVLTGFISTALLFLSPVFYPIERAPDFLQGWLYLNPLTLPIETVRALVFQGVLPQPWPWLIYCITSCAIAAVAWPLFNKLRNGFADVL